MKSIRPVAQPLVSPLPENLDLTTWQVLEDGSVLLRLTYMYTAGEHPTLSKPATVDICKLFGAKLCARLVNFIEMNAAGDVALDAVQRLQWKVKGEPEPAAVPPSVVPSPGANILVTVNPADTRTFRLVTKSPQEVLI